MATTETGQDDLTTSGAGGFFRCPVSPEMADGWLRVRRRQLRVQICEASIDGFTVVVAAPDATKLRLGQPWTLRHDGAVLEVHAQWLFHAPDGNVQVGLRRLRDLTPIPTISRWSWMGLRGSRCGIDSTHGIMIASVAIFGVVGILLMGRHTQLPERVASGLHQWLAMVASWFA